MSTPTKTALIIGGTSGIGLGIARHLVKSTSPVYDVTIAGRSVALGEAIIAESVSSGAAGKMVYEKLDAALMKNVRTFCEGYAKGLRAAEEADGQGRKVDYLVLSQGQLLFKKSPTEEGLQLAVALNYYGRILFVLELIRLEVLSPTATIVFILNARAGDPSGKTIQWNDMDLNGNTSVFKAIPHTFALMDIMLQSLAKDDKESGRTYIHDYPGYVDTEILNKGDAPWILKKINSITQMFKTYLTIDQAGEIITNGSIGLAEKNQAAAVSSDGPKQKTWYYMDESGNELEKVETGDEIKDKVKAHTLELLARVLGEREQGL